MPDKSFEEKFSQMAFLNVEESVPSLIEGDYWVGFQLVDKADDEKHAMGIMAFILNDLWLYIPIIYVNGNIKGHNIIYIQSVDLHIPAQDNWVSTLKEKGAASIGPLVDDMNDEESEELTDISIPAEETALKEASARLVEPEHIKKMFRKKLNPRAGFLEKLSMLGDGAVLCLARTILDSPDIANTFMEYHSKDEIEKLGEMAGEIEDRRSFKVEQPSLKVVRGLNDKQASELSDKEKKVLVKYGSYVDDNRVNTAPVFTAADPENRLTHPKFDGKYKVLMQDGSYKDLSIWTNVDNDGNCLVTDGDVNGLVQPSVIFGERREDTGDPEKATLRKLTEASRGESPKTVLFIKDGNKISAEYLPVYNEDKPGGITLLHGNDTVTPTFTGSPGNLSIHYNTLVIPEETGMKVFKDVSMLPFKFGDLSTVSAALKMSDHYTPLEIKGSEKTGMHINTPGDRKTFHDELSALEYLAGDVGIYAGQARSMLKQAEEGPAEYFVKNAFDVGVVAPISAKKTEATIEKEIPRKPQGLQPGKVIEDMTRAADSGIMEVFDTTVYKALIEGAGVTSFRKEFMLDLIRGMDSTARTLLILYWNYEMFKDRYGDKMEEVESKLQSVFENLGDLILFMKERTEAIPEGGETVWGTLAGDE